MTTEPSVSKRRTGLPLGLLGVGLFLGLGALQMRYLGSPNDHSLALVAATLGLLAAVSFGTAALLFWMARRPLAPRLAKAVVAYNVMLGVLGFGLLEAALEFYFLLALSSPPADQPLWKGFVLGSLIAGAVSLALAALRVARARWAYRLTFAFSVVILIWIPLGTALALYWLLYVRRLEQPEAMPLQRV